MQDLLINRVQRCVIQKYSVLPDDLTALLAGYTDFMIGELIIYLMAAKQEPGTLYISWRIGNDDRYSHQVMTVRFWRSELPFAGKDYDADYLDLPIMDRFEILSVHGVVMNGNENFVGCAGIEEIMELVLIDEGGDISGYINSLNFEYFMAFYSSFLCDALV